MRIKYAVAIWNDATDPRGTAAEKYFATRKLVLADLTGNVLRFHPRTPWRDENTGSTIYIPALIAAFRSIDDDAITGIHRIRLDQPARWPKAERRMLGVVHRAAVKLDPADAVEAPNRYCFGLTISIAVPQPGRCDPVHTGVVSRLVTFDRHQ